MLWYRCLATFFHESYSPTQSYVRGNITDRLNMPDPEFSTCEDSRFGQLTLHYQKNSINGFCDLANFISNSNLSYLQAGELFGIKTGWIMKADYNDVITQEDDWISLFQYVAERI